MEPRAASPAEAGAIAGIIARAFASDPVWEPALRRLDGRTDLHEPYWRLFVDGAMRHGTVRMTPGGEACSVWLPPGAAELGADQEPALEALLAEALDVGGRSAMETLYERFAASRRPLRPHYYLSLLATSPEHRGRGVGQALLAADLGVWDAAGMPAYLESTNPGNDHRYARAGFRVIGGFRSVRNDAPITPMWRDVGGGCVAHTTDAEESERPGLGRAVRAVRRVRPLPAAADHG
jgi:GNAT superfamily N-acetyltransferase